MLAASSLRDAIADGGYTLTVCWLFQPVRIPFLWKKNTAQINSYGPENERIIKIATDSGIYLQKEVTNLLSLVYMYHGTRRDPDADTGGRWLDS